MNRRWEFFVGQRYVRSRNTNGFLSFISRISMLGISIGVAVLVVVLSVVNGFERELGSRLLAMSADATISAYDDTMAGWQSKLGVVENAENVIAAAPFISEQGLLVYGNNYSGIELRGIDPTLERDVSGIAELASAGSLEALQERKYTIVLGDELAKALRVGVGDKLILMIAEGVVTPAGIMPRMRRFTVAGTYHAGMYEFDRRLAFVHLGDAARLFRYGKDVSGLRLKVDDIYNAGSIVHEAAMQLAGPLTVNDWTRRHSGFFRSIQITKSILFVILSLVVAVAAFNIVSTLVMVVKDKQRDIAILRTSGATPRSVMTIFIWQGALIGILGTAIGLGIGVLITLNFETIVAAIEGLSGQTLLAADVYFISDLPAELRWADVVKVGLIALALSFFSTLYPSWRAANTPPADALRYD